MIDDAGEGEGEEGGDEATGLLRYGDWGGHRDSPNSVRLRY